MCRWREKMMSTKTIRAISVAGTVPSMIVKYFSRRTEPPMAKGPEIPKTDSAEIEILIARLKENKLEQRDVELIERLLRTVLVLVNLLQRKNISIKRLRDMIFGRHTEKRKARSISQGAEEAEDGTESDPTTERRPSEKSQHQSPTMARGHGRRAMDRYRGAKKVECRHEQYQAGGKCPDTACPGRLYDTRRPNLFIQFEGRPMLEGIIFELEVLRCSACQERYVASLPEGVSEKRYEASADVAIVLAKYGAKLPFYRLAQMQESCGVPVSESVMFERSEQVADQVLPVYLALKKEAANGEVIHTDDTAVKILSCLKEDEEGRDERRATNTSGMVVKTGDGHLIALYASGRRHAGENLDQLLDGRDAELGPPIQMGDAAAVNWKGKHRRIEAKCWAHARRKFIEIEESFPAACIVVLEAIGKIYHYEAETVKMSDEERLAYHQGRSGPVIAELYEWIEEQFERRLVEPNSSLGQALRYLQRHRKELTRFLLLAKIPLDNNLVERALKPVVLMRKNSMFYKTEHGASISDLLMSVIESCRLNEVNAWDYLLTLVSSKAEVRRNPSAFLPWNYRRAELEGAA
jgi:transposase